MAVNNILPLMKHSVKHVKVDILSLMINYFAVSQLTTAKLTNKTHFYARPAMMVLLWKN